DDAKTTLTVTFKDGSRSFLVGGSVYGGSDRHVGDTQSHRAYVFSKDLISNLDIGESALHLIDAHRFDLGMMEGLTIDDGGKSKTFGRVQKDVEGQQVKTWGDPVTKKPDQTVANFIENTNNLRPTDYEPKLDVTQFAPVLKLTYLDAHGSRLGTLLLYKREKP